jgi:hypothetical protein
VCKNVEGLADVVNNGLAQNVDILVNPIREWLEANITRGAS